MQPLVCPFVDVVYLIYGLLTYMECVLHLSNLQSGTLFTFNDVDHVLGTAIGGGFDFEYLAGHCAEECLAHFYVGAGLAAWFLAPVISCVHFLHLTLSRLPAPNGHKLGRGEGGGDRL